MRDRERREMEAVVNASPQHLYTYRPEPGDIRFVFTDKVCRGLVEAYQHAVHLRDVEKAKA